MMGRPAVSLRMAGLRLALADGAQDVGADVLGGYVSSFRCRPCSRPDILIRLMNRQALEVVRGNPRSGAMLVDVGCFRGAKAGSAANRQRYLVLRDSGSLVIGGMLPDAVAVVGAIHVGLAVLLPERNGLLLHASAAGVDGRAIVFPGASGTGKSTACAAVPGAVKLGEDRCALVRRGSRWLVHSIPTWPGKYRAQPLAVMPCAGLVLVRKARPLAVRVPVLAEAASALLRSVVVAPGVAVSGERVLQLVMEVVGEVPCLELSYTLGQRFWPLLARRLGLSSRGGEA